jgi:thiamine-monophosphate kinase
MNEFEFIATFLAPLAAREKGALGLTDDAAIVKVPPGQELVITKDAIVQGVHFIGNELPGLIARKALRVNLSDLAAMGATPYAYFLALMLPSSVDKAWLEAFAEGLGADQKTYGITLMGGDTTHAPNALSLSVTALGLVPATKALLRNGAKPGDDIYVSGTIGDAALGLKVAHGTLQVPATARNYLLERYQLPRPRTMVGIQLHDIATSCIDISDGLVQDLGHICNASKVAARIRFDTIPLSPSARSALVSLENPYEIVLTGGDDYELLFTAPPAASAKLAAVANKTDVPFTRIGRISEGTGVRVLSAEGKEIVLSREGYRHF